MAEDRDRAALAGFDGYVEKPISVRDLPGQIEAFLARAGGLMDDPGDVLAVDDQPANLRLLDAVLTPRGHRVLTASSGAEGLCRARNRGRRPRPARHSDAGNGRARSLPKDPFDARDGVPSGGDDHRQREGAAAQRLQSGADDFVTKPFDQSELLARVASLARIKRYHDTIRRQAAELAAWNTELETRVAPQVAELERTNRLRRFLSPQLADLVIGDETSSRATAARSSSSSPICGTSPRSQRPVSPKR